MKTQAIISDIKRFAIHDGDGIRTTVFFKGCPLKCIWCHNPESISSKPQLAYIAQKCMNCGSCATLCNANKMEPNHIFDRNDCTLCGKCVDVCPNDAYKIYGTKISLEELEKAVIEDKEFYKTSGGGVTLSGGECLMQADFCEKFLKRMKSLDINTAVDTCGYVKTEVIDRVLPYTDTFLYDIKAIDENVHIRCTSVSNTIILDNLRHIDSAGGRIEVRIPYIPQYNDDQINKIGEFLKSVKNLTGVRILKYHNFAGSKYQSLDMKNTMPNNTPTDEMIVRAEKVIRNCGIHIIN